jgi:hypothetical protein
VRRHLIIPDTQVRPGVHLDHLDWIAQAIVDYRPDVVVHIGDHWDFPSLNSHDQPGSAPLENKRYMDDLTIGNAAFARLVKPMEDEIARTNNPKLHRKGWRPRKIFCTGNHETRADRVANNDPKLLGSIGSENCDVRHFERHPFLEVVEADGIIYSHYFQSSHSNRPIGGTIVNKLGRIGSSFVHGHVQGLDMGTKIMGNGKTLWGFQAGSCYTHIEDYRGAQGQRHWRGILVLNEVGNGECSPMPLTLNYLCQKYNPKYKGRDFALFDYMVDKYPGQDWVHLK